MTTHDHLIYQMQDMYSFHRDYLPLLDAMCHEAADERLKKILLRQHAGIRGEIETLERALNLVGAQYKMERSAVAPALHEAVQRFKHQMNPAQEQLDIHALLIATAVAQFAVGGYQGDIELAQVIGEQDIVTLLEENLHRQEEGIQLLRAYAPTLLQETSRGEISPMD